MDSQQLHDFAEQYMQQQQQQQQQQHHVVAAHQQHHSGYHVNHQENTSYHGDRGGGSGGMYVNAHGNSVSHPVHHHHPRGGVSQQTRHARRIYVGNIPSGYADEELLKAFLNNIVAKGLGEENDNSYVLSVYINLKKFFAFVEFKSVELTTAALELDGLLYHNSVLKVLRANEYKPELVSTPTMPPIKLHLLASAFGPPTGACAVGPPPLHPVASLASRPRSPTHRVAHHTMAAGSGPAHHAHMHHAGHPLPHESPSSSSTDQRLDYSFIQVAPRTHFTPPPGPI